MTAVLVASAMLSSTASAQIAVEIVPSIADAEAPVTLTLTASVSAEEPILGYEWRGLGIAPHCRARDCTIDLPVASCRRVEVSVIDRFGGFHTFEDQICAHELGASPPRAKIEVFDGDPLRVRARSEAGTATIAIERMWIDDREVERQGEIPADGECHAVELLVADVEGRVGLDQRVICNDPDAPQILVGADPTFCPRQGEMLRACAEVIDPLGRGVEPIGGEPVILDGCSELDPSAHVDRIVVRGKTREGETFGSMIACTAPSSGRPNLLFARLPREITVVRGQTRTAVLSIFGGEPPYALTGWLNGSRDIEISRSEIVASSLAIELSVPSQGRWDRLDLEITDARGLSAVVTASVSTTDPMMQKDPPTPQGTRGISCAAFPGEAIAWWLLPLLLIPILRRRR